VIREIRRNVTKVLEDLRKAGEIGNALQADVTVYASGGTMALLREIGAEALADIFLVSSVCIDEGDKLPTARKSADEKCPRCWRQGHGVGTHKVYKDLCERCGDVIADLVSKGEVTLE
jgi:isoleucyl-tRNA synthetase